MSTATAVAPPGADLTGRAEELTRQVLFVSLRINWWRGGGKIPGADIYLEGEAVADDLTTQASWSLMPRSWAQRFREVENRLRAVLANAAPRGQLVRGLHTIPAHRAGELFARLDQLVHAQFDPLVEEFLAAWPTIRTEQLARVKDAQRGAVERRLPPSAQYLRRHFNVDQHVVPVGGELGETLRGSEAAAFVDAIQARSRAFLEQTARSISDGLSQELQEAVDNLTQRLDAQGVVYGGTLDMVRRSFEKMKHFSFAAHPDVLARIAQVEEQLDITPQELNRDNRDGDRQLATGLVDALRQLRRSSEAQWRESQRGGRGLRAIDL